MGRDLRQEFPAIGQFSAGTHMTLNARTCLDSHARCGNITLDAATGRNEDAVLREHLTADFTCHADVGGLNVPEHDAAVSDVHSTAECDGALHSAAHFEIAAALDVADHDGAWTQN